jgi:hypothetical protein
MGINDRVRHRKLIVSFLLNNFTIVFTSVMVLVMKENLYYREIRILNWFSAPFIPYSKPERW